MKEKINNYISSLSQREKGMLGAFILVMFLVITLLVWFAMDSTMESAVSDAKSKTKMLQKIAGYKTLYSRSKNAEERVYKKLADNHTNLNSYISGVKESVNIEISTIKELKPTVKGMTKVEKIELSLRTIPLPELMTFLYSIENNNRFVFIESVSIKKRYDKRNYDASIVVATLKGGAVE